MINTNFFVPNKKSYNVSLQCHRLVFSHPTVSFLVYFNKLRIFLDAICDNTYNVYAVTSLDMYCCMSAGPSGDYLPPGVVPLIPGAKRKHRRVRFTGETEIIQAEKTQSEKGKVLNKFVRKFQCLAVSSLFEVITFRLLCRLIKKHMKAKLYINTNTMAQY